jgi:hypothetical protein
MGAALLTKQAPRVCAASSFLRSIYNLRYVASKQFFDWRDASSLENVLSSNTLRLLVALIGLTALLALLAATIYLAREQQPVGAILTGSGAGALAVAGFFALLRDIVSRP